MTPVIAWGLFAAIGLLAAVFACSQARVALRRRARRLHYLQAAQEQGRTHPHAARAISPEQVASISQDAQQAAMHVARNGLPRAANPHPARTRAFVLWEATFHSALSDCAELTEQARKPVAKSDATH